MIGRNEASQLAQALKPFIVKWLPDVARSGSGGTGALTAHDLSGPYHTGTLNRSQAPWVATDISAGIASHAALPDVHHARQHSITSTSDHTITGAALSVVGATATNTLGLITPSANPGTTESLLKATSGLLTLPQLTATTKVRTPLVDTASGGITLAPADYTVTLTGTRPVVISTHTGGITKQGSAGGWAFGFHAKGSAGTDLGGFGFYGTDDALVRYYIGPDYVSPTVAITAAGNVGVGTSSPSYKLDVVGTARVTTSVTTPLITTVGAGVDLTLSPSDDIVLTPGSNIVKLSASKVLQSDNYASQLTGMRITHDGQGDFRYLYTDEMHAKSLIADLEQALAGGQIIAKSVTLLYLNFTAPAAGASTTITVRDLPSATGMAVFQNSDFIGIRNFSRAWGGLDISDCWGTVTLDTTYGSSGFDSATKSQRYTFTRSAAPDAGAMTAGTTVYADAIILDYGTSGNGFYEVNAIDGLNAINSPYAQIVTWSGHPRTQTLRARLGNLYGIFAQANEYGLFSGNGTADTDQYLRISSTAVRLNNIPLRLHSGGVQTVNIDAAGTDIWIGPSSADKRLFWNGTTLAVTGQIVVQAGSSGYSNITDKPTNLSAINSSEGTKLAGIAANATVGATWGTNLNSIPTRFGDAPSSAGLYLTPTHLGYYNGSAWKAWIASSGEFYFGGSSGAHLEWNGSKLRGLGTDGTTEQWYAQSTDGKLYAGAGAIALDAMGFHVANSGASNGIILYRINTFEDIYKAGRLWALSDLSPARIYFSAGRSTADGDSSNATGILSLIAFNSSGVEAANVTLTGSSGTVTIGGNLASGPLSVTGNITVSGTVDGVDILAFKTAYDSHNHNSAYLQLSGGTLTGAVTAQVIAPATTNTYSVGDATHYYNAGYFNSLYVNTIVGTPTYSHFHAASDITTGTFGGTMTFASSAIIDADSAGTTNYVRWLTQTSTGKAWDLVARAHDYVTGAQQNDLLLTFYDGSTIYVAFQADSGTRVIDFGQTPTVSGAAVSLSGHTHDDRYYTESEVNSLLTGYVPTSRTVTAGAGLTGGGALSANITLSHADTSSQASVDNSGMTFIQDVTLDTYGHVTGLTSVDVSSVLTGYLRADGSIPGATSQIQSFTNGIIGPFVRPAANSTTALQLQNAGGTALFTIDTTNNRFGFGTQPAALFHLVGALGEIRVATSVTDTTQKSARFTVGHYLSAEEPLAGFIATSDVVENTILYGGGSGAANTATQLIFYAAANNVTTTGTAKMYIRSTGVFFGGTTPATAHADMAASTSSIAALRVRDGAAVSVPNSGDLWHVTGNLYLRSGATTYAIGANSSLGALTTTGDVEVGGEILTSNGSAATPSIAASSDPNTGLYWSAADTLAVSTGGVLRASFSSAGVALTGGSVSAAATLYLNAATANTVDLQVNGVSQWSASDARLNPRSTVTMDIGDYNRKIRTLHAAELYVETLVAQDVMSTIGGRVMVAPTTTLIADLASSAPSALYTNLIAYWKLDEASGNRADSKGSNTLTDTNTVTSIAGKQSNAAVFTKANSEYLTATDNSSLSVGDIDFYLACWIYPTLDDDTDQYIAAKAGASGNRAWQMWIDDDLFIHFQVFDASNNNSSVTASSFGALTLNTWYFVEAWHDSVGNVIGVAVNTTSNTSAHTTGVKDDTGPFQLGAANGANFYQGYIDEFGFWKYMPASGARTFLYNSGAGRTYTNISNWTTIDVKHNSLTAGTYIYMQAAPAGVAQIEALQVTAAGSAVTGGYRYPVIRNLDGTGANGWVAGDAVVSLGSAVGQGYIDLTSTSTIHSQLGPTITIFSRTATTAWNSVKPVVTMGNLRSFVDYVADEYGTGAGNDLTLTPTTGFAGYTIDRANGLRLFNANFSIYQSATKLIDINATDGVNIQAYTTSPADNFRKLNWWSDIGSRSGDPVASIYGQIIGSTWLTRIEAGHDGSHSGTVTLLAENANGSDIASLSVAAGGTPSIDLTATSIVLAGQVALSGDLDMNGNDILDIGTIGGSWTNLSFLSGWGNLGGGWQTGQYKKIGDIVMLRGFVVRTSGSSAYIATLPSGFRPPAPDRWAVTTDAGAHANVQIDSNGDMSVVVGSPTDYITLSGIIFSTI